VNEGLKESETKLFIPEDLSQVEVLGRQDEFLRLIENSFQAKISVRGNEIRITGVTEELEKMTSVFKEIFNLLAQGRKLDAHRVEQIVEIVKSGDELKPSEVFSDVILVHRGKAIGPKTRGQKKYVDAMRKSTVVFVIGPAGTGKTYLAMAMAVRSLKDKIVGRIILTRPAVEAGEKLGYLPGTLYEKVDPYFRPLYDALFDMMDPDEFRRHMEQGTIEVAPLAYMRGRTLNDSFIILDEAQNTTPEQMKMFLTRLGFGSKMVITGDVTQVDLPRSENSGLIVVQRILREIEGVSFVHLTAKDVVRHKLVQKIVEAYKLFEEEKGKNADKVRSGTTTEDS
jgi:phosphate starvation-inducible PhoH-like protein